MNVKVLDASAMVALLLDGGVAGEWVAQQIVGASISAPSLLHYEVANIIRRSEQAGLISHDAAVQAHADCLRLAVDVWDYEALADRAWQLRRNLTIYDAAYVALAELLEAPLFTLDKRIGKAPGLHCEVLVM